MNTVACRYRDVVRRRNRSGERQIAEQVYHLMRDALEREAQRSVPHKSFAVEYKRVVEASTLHEAVPPKIFKLGRESERSCFRNYIIKSLACNIVRDILCADRRTRIIYHVAYAEFFRRNGGEKTFSSVLFEGYR